MIDTYIVSGRIRSGTSMMMHSCIVGGLKGSYIADKEFIRSPNIHSNRPPHPDIHVEYQVNFLPGDYHPNPNGFFEGSTLNYYNDDVTSIIAKVLSIRLVHLPIVDNLRYNIVFMVRPDAEVILSAEAAYGATNLVDHLISIEEARAIIDARPDFEAIYLNYVDVVDNPMREFAKLTAAGWPIDVAKAATIPTDKLYRNRI